MELIDNINHLLGDNLKQSITPRAKLKIAASCFSIYAFEALNAELEGINALEFIFTSPTFVPGEVTDSGRKEHREFHIPKAQRERSFYGSEFEIRLKNKLTQKAIARECANWMRRKATFRSNRSKAPMQQFACLETDDAQMVYQPLHGFTAVDLGYQRGDAVSNFVNKIDDAAFAGTYLALFNQIWNDPEKIEDVTDRLCDHIASVYQENSPERIYFFMLFNIFSEFLEDISEDVLPNDLTGYQDSLVWQKLYNFQRDAATGIINKLESYNGCILADSVGLGKTFSALAVIKYYELRNRSVLVLCPKKLADNWLNYNRNLKTNIFAQDRFNYDVLCHTDLQRTTGESFGTPLDRINWGNYDLVVIDESHNFRNNDAFKDRETRYQRLMNAVVKDGVKTKVLMLSATPVNNRFNDLRNQLALAYEGDSEKLSEKLRSERDIEEIFRRAQATFNAWSKRPPEERTAEAILDALDFDFFELLDSVTIARSRKHIEYFYDTADIGNFPERRKPISIHCQLTHRYDVMHPVTGQPCKEPLMGYRFPEETMSRLLSEGTILFGEDHTKLIELKSYAHEYQEKLSSVIELDGRSGAYDVRSLFPEFKTTFKNPKPVKFLQRFIPLVLNEDGNTVMDFFAGSCTTAQAVMELNHKDGVRRHFIMAQLPEPCNENSEPAQQGIQTISEISKERIRRAGKKIKEEAGLNGQNLDIGFRVLKLDTSNMKDVYYTPDKVNQENLLGQIDNIKADRTDEDLLFQVLLDWGVDLTLPINPETIAGKTVYFVDTNALAACFETGIDEDFVKALAKRKPLRAVFRDTGYGSDATKINVEQIFKLISPTTEVKSI